MVQEARNEAKVDNYDCCQDVDEDFALMMTPMMCGHKARTISLNVRPNTICETVLFVHTHVAELIELVEYESLSKSVHV